MPTSLQDGLCRLVLAARTATAILAAAYLLLALGATPGVMAAVALTAATSYLPYRCSAQFVVWLRRYPALLLADVLASAWLFVSFGSDGPYLLVAAATMPLAGLLGGIRWALPYTAAELTAYALGAMWNPTEDWSFPTIVAGPGLCLVTAGVGVASHRLLARHADEERARRASDEHAAVTQDRARLARDMHDSLGKTLYGIGMAAEALPLWIQRDGGVAAQKAAALHRSSSAALSQLREVIVGLRADPAPADIAAAIRSAVQTWSADCGVAVAMGIDVTMAPRFDGDTREQILAVLGEALTNVDRHAAARRVGITTTCRRGVFELRLQDDGHGFDPSSATHQDQRRFGLVGMVERAHSIGGRLSMCSRAGEGTEVILRVPLNDRNALGNHEEVRS